MKRLRCVTCGEDFSYRKHRANCFECKPKVDQLLASPEVRHCLYCGREFTTNQIERLTCRKGCRIKNPSEGFCLWCACVLDVRIGVGRPRSYCSHRCAVEAKTICYRDGVTDYTALLQELWSTPEGREVLSRWRSAWQRAKVNRKIAAVIRNPNKLGELNETEVRILQQSVR